MYRKQVRRRTGGAVAARRRLADAPQPLSSGRASGGPLHGFERGVSTVLGPFEEGADRALKPARDLVNWFQETFEARGENEELEDEVAEPPRPARRAADHGAPAGDELAKLGALTGGGLVPEGQETVTARVVGPLADASGTRR